MLGASLERVILNPKTPKNAARALERIVRAGRSVRTSRDRSQRRDLVNAIPRKPEFTNRLDPMRGYGIIPNGTLDRVPAAIDFAQKVLEERRDQERGNKASDPFFAHVLTPLRYEEAPPIFDLALSDEVLQIAADYLGEVPILLRITVSWSPVNNHMAGSQLYHRDGQSWLQRRAKFIFAASDVDEASGPFTFLPAELSERVSKNFRSFKMQHRVEDEDMYRFVCPADEIKFVGPAGTGLVLDSGRCFHFGSRTRGKERLMIFFQFWNSIDLQAGRGGKMRRSGAFETKFANDPVRRLLIPVDNKTAKSSAANKH
jgi:hypothetical protein